MSSTYRVLCLSHDPAITTETDYRTPGDAEHAIATGIDGHTGCDLLIGRYSYPLIEAGCPPANHPRCSHNRTQWDDSSLLRLLATAYASTDETVRKTTEDSHFQCWPRDRLWRLREELDIDVPALNPDGPAPPTPPADDLRGGFWPDIRGGLCPDCHLANNRGGYVHPDHPECLAIWRRNENTPAPKETP